MNTSENKKWDFDPIDKLRGNMALAGHHHVRQVFWYETEGQKMRFEQAAAVVESVKDNNEVMPSGVTLYTVINGKIDEGKFIRLDKK